MIVRTFVKRLNATELGTSATHDSYLAIPRNVDLSQMFQNREPIRLIDRNNGKTYCPEETNVMYVQTNQNNQERISGLGFYFVENNILVGDEITIQKIEFDDGNEEYAIFFKRRNAIVLQKLSANFEILTFEKLEPYKKGNDYYLKVFHNGKEKQLELKYAGQKKKKTRSKKETKNYQLLLDGEDVGDEFAYQEYLEILPNMKFEIMNSCIYSMIER